MIDKLDGLSMDIEAENKDKLQSVFPECFIEGRLDIDKLLSLCGEYITDDFEKYEFKWKGKSECLRLAQKRSTATLRPCPTESVNFDTTKNLYIEGDNLEVLKLLQKSYFRKVKMIYIDPPYNTGNDFVYEDDFKDPLARYKEVTEQTTKSNPETMGRYHTNWLNMIYPRLRLAANLLRDDGVIFISIDDNEADNLKKLCNEVFGEENFIAQLIWQKSKKGDAKLISVCHEYVFIYAKSQVTLLNDGVKWRQPKQGLDEIFAHYEQLRAKYGSNHEEIQKQMKQWYSSLPSTHPARASKHYCYSDDRGLYFADNFAGPDDGRASRPRYDIIHPATGLPCKKPSTGWRWDEARTRAALEMTPPLIHFGTTHETIPCRKSYLKDVNKEPFSSVFYKDGRSATLKVEQLLGAGIFDFPKDEDILASFICLVSSKDDIILDFFSGSASTATAVFQANGQDKQKRQFIMVQLPEVCAEKSGAFKVGYKNVCEIGKERIRRAGKKVMEVDGGQTSIGEDEPTVDVGFKVFKLDSSNMKLWDDTPIEDSDIETLLNRMTGHIDGLKADRSDEDLIYEILLKMGYALTTDITAFDVGGLTVYKVEGGSMLICLQEGVTAEHIEQMAALAPQKIVLAGRSLADSSAKANAFYLLNNQGIELKTV